MTDRYAVIGNPVDHSRSPDIHAAFAEQTGEDIVYDKLFADHGAFTETAARFFAEGGQGLNVTVPFKADALRFADSLSQRASLAAAVNTLIQCGNDQRRGDNTDGVGLYRDLSVNQGLTLGKLRILVLGAGGGVAGVLGPLLAAGPKRLVVANRTAEKAAILAHRFNEVGAARGLGFEEAGDFGPYDLVINGTSAGLTGEMPTLPDGLFAADAVAYDMVYGTELTVFLRWAKQQGVARCIDGFGMLVEQAAESFYLWRGVRPQTAPVIDRLRPK